jgi:hypothetical protein
VNSAKLHQVNASWTFRAECLEQLAKSLHIQSSPCMFSQVLGYSAESLDGLQTRSWEVISWEVIFANVKQSVCLTLGILKSLYPLADFNAVVTGPT